MLSMDDMCDVFRMIPSFRDKIVFLVTLAGDKVCRLSINYHDFREKILVDLMKRFEWKYNVRHTLETRMELACRRLHMLSTCQTCGATCCNSSAFSYRSRQTVCVTCLHKECEDDLCECGKPIFLSCSGRFVKKPNDLSIFSVHQRPTQWFIMGDHQNPLDMYYVNVFTAACQLGRRRGGCDFKKRMAGSHKSLAEKAARKRKREDL